MGKDKTAGKNLHPMPLSNGQKKYLRGLGHALNPIMQIGKEGLSKAFETQLVQALRDHELVKVKILQNAPITKEEANEVFLNAKYATLVQRIGKTFLLYSPHPDEPGIQLPRLRKSRGRPES